jgi:predicted RNA methylase
MANVKLEPEIENILRRSTTKGNVLKLPPGQLARETYLKVKKALETLGGKWKGNAGGFLFATEGFAQSLTRSLETGEVVDKKKLRQAFYTPPELAEQIAFIAGVSGDVVLEPSAGHGALADAAEIAGASHVVCIESEPECKDALTKPNRTVSIQDFLTVEPNFNVHVVLMNPPFTRNQDTRHIEHALKFLTTGGRLYSVTPDKDNDKLAALGARTVTKFPAGAFKVSGTNVATRLITIEA